MHRQKELLLQKRGGYHYHHHRHQHPAEMEGAAGRHELYGECGPLPKHRGSGSGRKRYLREAAETFDGYEPPPEPGDEFADKENRRGTYLEWTRPKRTRYSPVYEHDRNHLSHRLVRQDYLEQRPQRRRLYARELSPQQKRDTHGLLHAGHMGDCDYEQPSPPQHVENAILHNVLPHIDRMAVVEHGRDLARESTEITTPGRAVGDHESIGATVCNVQKSPVHGTAEKGKKEQVSVEKQETKGAQHGSCVTALDGTAYTLPWKLPLVLQRLLETNINLRRLFGLRPVDIGGDIEGPMRRQTDMEGRKALVKRWIEDWTFENQELIIRHMDSGGEGLKSGDNIVHVGQNTAPLISHLLEQTRKVERERESLRTESVLLAQESEIRRLKEVRKIVQIHRFMFSTFDLRRLDAGSARPEA